MCQIIEPLTQIHTMTATQCEQWTNALPKLASQVVQYSPLWTCLAVITKCCQIKTARVVPVHKSDSNSLFNNYRPISLLPSLSKLLEKCAAKQMFGFIEKNKILYDFQFGFRRNHNTTQPVLHFLDKIYYSLNKDDPEYTISIFLDLKKPLILYHIAFYQKSLNIMVSEDFLIFGSLII